MDLNKIMFSILNFNQSKMFVSNACMIKFCGMIVREAQGLEQ